MARVKFIEKAEASPKVQEVYQQIEDNGAKVINLFKTLANSPTAIMLNTVRLGNSILRQTALSPKLREMTILRVGQVCGCEYEWKQHAAVALEVGVTAEQQAGLKDWQKSGAFSEQERAVLQYVDEVAAGVSVSDKAFNALKKLFNDQVIVELTVTIGYYSMLARVLVPLQVDIDENFVTSLSQLTGKKGEGK